MVLKTVNYFLCDYWAQNGDPRLSEYKLMSSFEPVVCILLIYAVFVLYLGPKWMSTRKAYSLKTPLLFYNGFMSVLNLTFVFIILRHHNWGLDMFEMKFPDFRDNSARLQNLLWWHQLYVISKLVDLLDTVFFVLRKKQSQVTWLHFYHHFSVPIQAWLYVRLHGNSAITISFAFINSIVHTVMYAYYGLSALGPKVRRHLWWKRYLTQLQIWQFILIILYGIYFACYQEGYPWLFYWNMLAQAILYTGLFSRFYLHTYKEKNGVRNNNVGKMLVNGTNGKVE